MKRWNIGDRVYCTETKASGTVRGDYVDPTSKAHLLDIEWDDAAIGITDGTCVKLFHLNGISFLTSMSFGIHSRTIDSPVSFEKALELRYCQSAANDDPIEFEGGKTVELLGIESAERRFNQLNSLEYFDVGSFRISYIAQDVHSGEPTTYVALKQLCIDYNLFKYWSSIQQLLDRMPKLNRLECSHCRFERPAPDLRHSLDGELMGESFKSWIANTSKVYVNLMHLVLYDAGVEMTDLFNVIYPSFPSIEHLDLSQNPQLFDAIGRKHIEDFLSAKSLKDNSTVKSETDECRFRDWPVKTLSLMCNRLSCWRNAMLLPTVLCPALRSLILSENDLGDINQSVHDEILEMLRGESAQDAQNTTTPINNITELFLDENKISKWGTIHYLSKIFPRLRHFKWQHNPCQEPQGASSWETTITRQIVIAVFPDLLSLNGSEVSSDERKHAELYFLSLASRQHLRIIEVDPEQCHERRLESIHHAEFVKVQETGKDKAKLVQIDLIPLRLLCQKPGSASGKHEHTLEVASWLTIGDLKRLCEKYFSIPFTQMKLKMVTRDKIRVTYDLDDNQCSLDFYGVSPHTAILVEHVGSSF